MSDIDTVTEEYLDPQERLYREREEKKAAALTKATEATTDQLVKRKRNRLSIAVNIGTDDDPEYVKVTFEAMKRNEYDDLLDAHTPQATEDDPEPDENRETFGPAVISECAIKPKLSLEQAQTIWTEWSRAEALTLYQAAITVNMGSRLEVLGNV